MTEKIENKVSETKDNFLNSYKEMAKKLKELERELKKTEEGSKGVKEFKKSESKIRPEKPEEYKSLLSKFQTFIKANILEVEKIFLASVTTDKPEGQKWIIFNLGEKEKFSFGIIRNKTKKE
jgi:predicted ATPase